MPRSAERDSLLAAQQDVCRIGRQVALGWEIARDTPEFSQRLWVTFADEDNTMIGRSKLTEDNETWNDDLEINDCRARGLTTRTQGGA